MGVWYCARALALSTFNTAWKVSVFAVFLVRIFPHWDWIQGFTECGFWMRTLFTQWEGLDCGLDGANWVYDSGEGYAGGSGGGACYNKVVKI